MSIRTAPACEPTMTWTAPPGSHGGSPRLAGQADTSRPAGESRVHASYWWITEDGTYLGAITLRDELNEVLLRAGGHIGYGIRPSARGRGLATWALQSVLVRAPALGLRKVLVTCGDGNLASARVIEK